MSAVNKNYEKNQALNELRKSDLIEKGMTVFTILRHVSRSGMYRAIDLYIIDHNRPLRISHLVAPILEGYDKKHMACRATGCGMDMGFHLVDRLSRSLFGEAGALNQQWI